MITVTKPFLPPQEEYKKYMDQIWQRNWLTNDGPLVKELEVQLTSYLNLKNLHFVSNGTVALQLAIKALNLSNEVITTPFSYVATTSSIVWENCTPIFVDIDPQRLTIDPMKIEAAITVNTSAILATHVYGIPCHIEEIKAIATKHNLKVIYDAAHAFGTKYKNKSLLDYGDISTLSTHATKLFHTVEGGAVICKSKEDHDKFKYLRNFGHDGPGKFNGLGINGKNSEFHVAMGLCNLKYLDKIITKRRSDSLLYDSLLQSDQIIRPLIPKDTEYNYSYYPIIFETEDTTLKVLRELKRHEIFPRRYFYPALNKLDYVTDKLNTPVCDDICKRILCLPLYFDLTKEEIDMISRIIIRTLKN